MGVNCHICGNKFKSEFALKGHLKMKDDEVHRAFRGKNAKSNNQPGTSKSVVQPLMLPPEIIEKAKELIEKKNRDKITNEYFKTTIQPMFDSDKWLDNNKHKTILAKKDEDHKSEISVINYYHQMEIEYRDKLIDNLKIQNNDLSRQIVDLTNYIDHKLDEEVGQKQEELNHKNEIFKDETTEFALYRLKEQSKLDEGKDELEKQQKNMKTRERNVDEREVNLKEREDEFDKNESFFREELEEIIKTVKERVKKVTESEKKLKKFADETESKFNLERKEIKKSKAELEREIKNIVIELKDEIKKDREQIDKERNEIDKIKKELEAKRQRLEKRERRQREKLISNIFSHRNNVNETTKFFNDTDPGANQNDPRLIGNHSKDEINSEQHTPTVLLLVSTSGEPVIQSGIYPILLSGDEVKSVESNCEPVFQSGYIKNYSGIGNLN